MAWTLHPALFYEKYGTVLVQLWESGAFGTMFRPVRRLSKGIGDRITSLRLQRSVAAPPKPIAEAEAEVLTLTDDSVATDDEALSRVNREPGDTSPEPSTSQQNELAFQGDIYTQMRRSRRQRERIQKIRETREKFLEAGSSGSGSKFGRKRRGFHARRDSIMAFKKDKGLRKATGGGTPLTDMEGADPVRAVVIDVSTGSPASAGSSEDEDDAAGTAGKRGARIKPEELLEENDSPQTLRDVCSPRKKGHASPPPNMREPSESQTTDTASLASTAATDQAAVGKTPPPKKLAEPFAAAKSPRKSALRKRKVSRRASAVSSGSAGEQATKTAPEKPPSIATTDSSSAVVGKACQPQADFSSATSLLSTKEPIASDKGHAPTSPADSVAKKDKAKRLKSKVRSHKKKAKGKSAKTAHGLGERSPSTLEELYTGGDVDSGAVSKDKPRRKHEKAGIPSQEEARSCVAGRPIANKEYSLSTGAMAPSPAAEATRSDTSALRQSSLGGGSHLDAKITKQDSTVTPKTSLPHSLRKRTAGKGEERVAEAKPSAKTPVDAALSSEATPVATSQEGAGVHKRRTKKHRNPKSPAAVVETSSGAATSARDAEPGRFGAVTPRPASPDSAERVFDEAVAVRHHRRRSHGRSKKHAKEDGRRRHSRKAKEDRPAESTSPTTGGQLPSATIANATADVGDCPSSVEDSAAATAREEVVADVASSAVSAPSPRSGVMTPTADVTLSGTDAMFSLDGDRSPPIATTAVKGDDVTVHVDMTAHDRAAMFWPFGRRGHKKKEVKRP
nr:uncharacterized protein LOC126543576 [Dermacentor andersoni]